MLTCLTIGNNNLSNRFSVGYESEFNVRVGSTRGKIVEIGKINRLSVKGMRGYV